MKNLTKNPAPKTVKSPQNPFAKLLAKTLWFFLYALPAVLFFSYHPVISLGANDSMNFELSLPLIWLVLFDLGAFILLLVLAFSQKTPQPSPQPSPQNLPQSSPQPSPQASSQAPSEHHSRATVNLPGLTDRRFFLLALFPLYLTLSVLWSDNRLRGLLTAGVMWLVFFAVFAILYILPLASPPRRLRTHVLLVLFISSVLVCKFCYTQSIMDVLGVSRDTTLLCKGCTYQSFGFPHPSGFAIEPQFMGNLLLAPTLTAIYLVVFRPHRSAKNLTREADRLEAKIESKIEPPALRGKIHLPHVNWSRWQTIGMTLLAGFLSMTLFFTFSRGAIYAYAVALLVLFIFAIKRHTFRWSLIGIPVVSFLLALTLQGTFAAVGPTAETFVSGVTKSIHQLSLGIIDLRPQTSPESVENSNNPVDNSQESVQNQPQDCAKPVQNSSASVDKTSESCAKPEEKVPESVEKLAGTVDKLVQNHEEKSTISTEKAAESAIFEGYVPESTNIRLQLNQVAIQTWLSTPSRVFFGVGLGGAGVAMHAAHPDQVTSSKEIVQHQGFSLLLETGLLGVALATFGLLIAFFPNLFSKKFLDGKSTSTPQTLPAFWQHPARPLLLSLVIAYLVTLNFFSGLPNALQIYLMPPLFYLIFTPVTTNFRSIS